MIKNITDSGVIFKSFVDSHHLSVSEAMELLNISSKNAYYNYLKGSMGIRTKAKICNAIGLNIYNLSERELAKYDVEVSREKYESIINKIKGDKRKFLIPEIENTPLTKSNKDVPYYDNIPVYAGLEEIMSEANMLPDNYFERIPALSRAEAVMPVHGRSMQGYINEGDMIAVRKMNDVNRIIYGAPYLLITRANNLRTVKFLNQHDDDSKLWLSSYNIEQFKSQEIDKDDILAIFSIEGLMRPLN